MKIQNACQISFPVPFAEIPPWICCWNVSRQVASERLGPPAVTDWVEGLGEADFWAFEFPCGLKVVCELVHLSHFARIDDEQFRSHLKQIISLDPTRQSEIESLRSFQVWRQGDDGVPIEIGEPTSERDAKCWIHQLESGGHKQLYWSTRVKDR
jgi:hypothetical protein